MRNWILLLMLAFAVPVTAAEPPPQRVLFVGNSLTYVGNLPATFAALVNASGQPVDSHMIVRGGATLSQRVADDSVQKALAALKPDVLVLQERGGDLIGAFGHTAEEESRKAIGALTQAGHDAGARVLLLGSYQSSPGVSVRLVQRESQAAAEGGATYVAISEHLRQLSAEVPTAAWFDADGMHPGPALALLNAIQLHRELYGSVPVRSFDVSAPIYLPKSGLESALRNADAPPPLADTPMHIHYDQTLIDRISTALDAGTR